MLDSDLIPWGRKLHRHLLWLARQPEPIPQHFWFSLQGAIAAAESGQPGGMTMLQAAYDGWQEFPAHIRRQVEEAEVDMVPDVLPSELVPDEDRVAEASRALGRELRGRLQWLEAEIARRGEDALTDSGRVVVEALRVSGRAVEGDVRGAPMLVQGALFLAGAHDVEDVFRRGPGLRVLPGPQNTR